MKIRKEILNNEISLIRQYSSKANLYKDMINLGIGEPSKNTNKEIINSCINSLQNNNTHYIESRGKKELIELIALKEKVNEDQVIVTCGATEGIFITLLSLISKDDEVLVINPSYPMYAPMIEFLGGKVKYIETSNTNFIPTYTSLIKEINDKTKAIILNCPNNPTGIIYPKQTFKMINELCIKSNIAVINDLVYENIIYNDLPLFDFNLDNSIRVKSFSKPYSMTGFRLGYIVSNKAFIKNALKIHSYLTISLPEFIQDAGIKALETKCIINDFKENLIYTTDVLNELFLDYIKPDGGIFLLVNIEEFNLSSKEFCDRLMNDKHLITIPGEAFNIEGYIRLSFCVEKTILHEALSRFEEFIISLRNSEFNDLFKI